MHTPTELSTAIEQEVDEVRALARPSIAKRVISSNLAWLVLVDFALVVIFGALSIDHVFWSIQSFQALMLNGSEILLLALAITAMLGAGVIDISVGANLVLSSVVGATVITHITGQPITSGTYPNETIGFNHAGLAIAAGLIVCVCAGTLFGLVNGLIIAYLDVNSLVTTLGTMGVGTGIALVFTNGTDIINLPSELQSGFALSTFLKTPLPAVVALIMAVVLWCIFRYLRYGLRTLAIGSSLSGAERAGLHVRRHIVTLVALGGLLAGLAGFLDIAHYSATVVNGHANDAMAAITGAVIGGTAFEGGRVSIAGTVAGTALSVILLSGLTIIQVQSFWQLIVTGVILIAAIAIGRYRYRRRAMSN